MIQKNACNLTGICLVPIFRYLRLTQLVDPGVHSMARVNLGPLINFIVLQIIVQHVDFRSLDLLKLVEIPSTST